EDSVRERFLKAKEDLPDLEHVIVVDGPEANLQEVVSAGEEVDLDEVAVDPDDTLTLIYTSGTTGPPKGVELSHRNLLAAISTIKDIIDFPDGSSVISWLPSAHVAERNAHHYIPVYYGFTVTTCDNPREILGYLPKVRPTWFFAVPRIWEKLKAGLEAGIEAEQDEERKKATLWALDVGLRKVRLEQAGEEVPQDLLDEHAKADGQVLSTIRSI